MVIKRETLSVVMVTLVIVMAELALSSFAFLMPSIKTNLSVSDVWLECCFSISVLSLGVAGLLYGLFTDIVGRRPMFLFSLGLFSLASFMAFQSVSPFVFMVARVLQSAGAGAAWVVGNALLGDLFLGKEYVRVMNKVHAVAGIVPAVSPIVNTYLLSLMLWKYIYLIFGVVTLFLFGIIYHYQQETLPHRKAVRSVFAKYRFKRLFLCRRFCSYLWIKAISVGMMFTIVAQFPLICVESYHLTQAGLWVAMLPLFASYIFASSLCAKLYQHVASYYLIMAGIIMLAIGGVMMLLCENSCSINQTIIPIACVFFGFGCIFGNATAKIVSAVPSHSGLASSLMIFMEMMLSALFVYVMSLFMDASFFPLAIFFVVMTTFLALPLLLGWTSRYSVIAEE